MNVKTIAIGVLIGQWLFAVSVGVVYLAISVVLGIAGAGFPPEMFVIGAAVIASLVAIGVYLSRRGPALIQS